MEQLLNKLFTASQFRKNETFNFYFRENESALEYYLVDFIGTDQLENYLDSEQFNQLFSRFKSAADSGDDIRKNTSLILCVTCPELPLSSSLQNKILRIEEDEFWFKKYVIQYNSEVVAFFNQQEDTISTVNRLVQNSQLFENMKDNRPDWRYHLAMQFYLKMPFLTLTSISRDEIQTIEQELNAVLSPEQISLIAKISSFVEQPDFEDHLEQIEKAAVKLTDQKTIIDFVNNFTNND